MIKKYSDYKLNEDIIIDNNKGYHILSIANHYKNICKGKELSFVKSMHEVSKNRITSYTENDNKIKFKCKEFFTQKTYDENTKNTKFKSCILDTNDITHILPIDRIINFSLPKRKYTKEDPYGEENWDY